MPTRYDLEMQFEVVIQNIQTISTNAQQLGGDTMVWFADGTKMNAAIGIGVFVRSYIRPKLATKTTSKKALEVHESTSYQISK